MSEKIKIQNLENDSRNKRPSKKFLLPVFILISLLAVFSLAVKAHAYSGDTVTITTEEIEIDNIPADDTVPLAPDGNLTLADDVIGNDESCENIKSGNKEFLTVKTRDGNWFYIIIDRDGTSNNVYFLDQVDDEDLYALTGGETHETGSTENEYVCTCSEKCTAGNVNTSCPVCSDNMTECVGKEIPSAEDETGSGNEAIDENDGSPNGKILKIAVLVLLTTGFGAGIWFAWKKVMRPDDTKGSVVPDDEYLKDAGESVRNEEYEDAVILEELKKNPEDITFDVEGEDSIGKQPE